MWKTKTWLAQKHWLILILILATFLLVRCQSGERAANKDLPMQQLLEKVNRESFFVPANVYASRTRVAHFDSLLTLSPPHEKNKYRYLKAEALLYGGETSAAIALLEELYRDKLTSRFMSGLEDHQENNIEPLLALAYMRLGEQENCLLNHTSASCIVPVRAPGFHRLPQGSERAIRLYEDILQNNSRDLSSRWLLNVAYMTLNKYPAEVPPQWLIPEKAFQSEYPLRPFTDIAARLGLDVQGHAGGGVIDDFTNNGYLDVLVSDWFGNQPMHFFVNNGDGTFSDRTEAAGLTGITGGLNMVQADYNNDGFTDVLILRGAWLEELGGHPNSLLRNNGDGTFTDVTREAGLLSFHPTQTAVWRDFNNDGWLDIFIGNESSGPENSHPCELYLNQGNGTFREVAQEAGVAISQQDGIFTYVKGVTAGDYDNDGRQDIYISALDDRTPNILLRNTGVNTEGIPTFSKTSIEAGLGENLSSFPTWFWDYDNDGWLDLFVAGFRRSTPWGSITKDIAAEYLAQPHTAETARLYRNNGDGTFTNVSEAAGLKKITYAMGANFGDLDNDGFLDMYLATGEVNFASIIPNRMFRNEGGKTFQDVTTAGGFGHLQKGHAVSFADLDNDGDQDIHVVLGGAYEGDVFQNALFENPYQNDNNWISLKLTGTRANRSAIGSRVRLRIQDNGRTREVYRDVSSGGSFGCSPLRLHIGLGKSSRIDELEIQWAGSGTRQLFKDIGINQFIHLTEDQNSIVPLPIKYTPFPAMNHSLHH